MQDLPSPSRTPEHWFHEQATAYVASQVLFHLNEARVLLALDEDSERTAASLAEELGLDPHILSCCLEYLAGVSELLESTDEHYSFTDFGKEVLDRYCRTDTDGRCFNFFDVRVGSYGPVWAGLGEMLHGAPYAGARHRAGEYAAQGVYKVAAQLLPHVEQVAAELGISRVVEFGVPTGLLAALCQKHPSITAFGVDRSREALVDARKRAEELGVADIDFIHGDFFEPKTWLPQISGEGPLAIASIHFHEFVADGGQRLTETLQRLREEVPGAYVIAIEQERLTPDRRKDVSETVWLYAQSNVLIHHLIRNGQIFTGEQWVSLFTDAGCTVAAVRPLGYLGYHLYAFQL